MIYEYSLERDHGSYTTIADTFRDGEFRTEILKHLGVDDE
jgi:hypothetical protein